MPHDYSRIRETLFDVYTERDGLAWYYRAIATVASWLALAGYILAAIVFTTQQDNLKAGKLLLTILAGTSAVVGYFGLLMIAILSRSVLFCFDAVLLPTLTSSSMGMVLTILNHALHRRFPIPNEAYIYLPLVTACTTTVITALLSAVFYRRINQIKSVDKRRRKHVSRWERQSLGGYSDTQSTSELLPMTIPEDEAQRRQLLRLLLQRENGRAPSPEPGSTTYKIDWPTSNHEGQYLTVPASRPRSESLPNTKRRWNLSKFWNRQENAPIGEFKDPRLRRREEIERSSMSASPRQDYIWPQTPNTPPVWTGNSSRYA